MKKFGIEIIWAFVFVAMSLAWMYLEKLTGLHSQHIGKHYIYSNLMAIPAIGIYVLALLHKRHTFYEGDMSWLQGFISGLIITLFVTILSPLTQVITTKFITPEYFPNIIEYMVNKGKMTLDVAESCFSLRSYIIQGFLGAPILGAITSALVAIFIRTKSKN
ncbi:MAG: DUF4199 domain-containing protein [Bacteroidales bacterium]|nr:DUF4199 domain-containing protein [Bacteroidales bacterium]